MTDRQARLQWWTITDIGLVRKQNEDFVQVVPPAGSETPPGGQLCVVADGMGGQRGGALASRIAAGRVIHHYYQQLSGTARENLVQAIVRAGRDIVDAAAADAEVAQMGTTIVAALVDGERAIIANIGDSRAYLWHDATLTQLSIDDRWVVQQLADGLLSSEQAAIHPQRNILTQYLGSRDAVQPHLREVLLRRADRLLLCSDGLYELVTDRELAAVLARMPARRALKHLLALARQRGAPDNVTIAIADYDRPAVRGDRRAAGVLTAGTLLLLLALAVLVQAMPATSGALTPPQRRTLEAPLPSAERGTVTPNPTVARRRTETAAALFAPREPTVAATGVTVAATATRRPVTPSALPSVAVLVPLELVEITSSRQLAEPERSVYLACPLDPLYPRLIFAATQPLRVALRFTFTAANGSAEIPAGLSVRQPSPYQCFPLEGRGVIGYRVALLDGSTEDGTLIAAGDAEFQPGRVYLLRVAAPAEYLRQP